MTRILTLAACAAAGVWLGAGGGPAAADAAPDRVAAGATTETAAASAAAGRRGTRLTLKRSPYGRVLFADGYAMYVFTRDRGSRSRCRGACAKAWPPLLAKRRLTTGRGVKRRLVGVTRRPSGKRQLTFGGQPLYGYVHDPRGRVLCHDVDEFGGLWLAVRKSGKPAP